MNTTLLTYIGSKGKLVETIKAIFPPHICYVEAFGGSGVILLNKPPSFVEVYNDYNNDLVNLFRVVREQKTFGELERVLNLTLYARNEWEEARKILGHPEITDPVQRAWAMFVAFNQSVNGAILQNDKMSKTPKRGGWAKSNKRGKNGSFWYKVNNLQKIHERLKSVQIEHKHFLDVIAFYDTPDTLFYLDPPYVSATRSEEKSYQYELYNFEHKELLEIITACQGKVILSGYDNELYRECLHNWNRIDFETMSGARGDGVHVERVETIWYNYELPKLEREHPLQLQLLEL